MEGLLSTGPTPSSYIWIPFLFEAHQQKEYFSLKDDWKTIINSPLNVVECRPASVYCAVYNVQVVQGKIL